MRGWWSDRRAAVALLAVLCLSLSGGVSAQDEDDSAEATVVVAPAVLERANRAFLAENYEQAVVEYSLFLLLNPTHSSAYRDRAISQRERGQFDAALADFEEALAHATDPTRLYIERARTHRAAGDPDAALADFERALPTADPSARLAIYSEQIDLLAAADRLANGSPDAAVFFRRASLHQTLGNMTAAASDFAQWIALTTTETVATGTPSAGAPLILSSAATRTHITRVEVEAGQTLNIVASNLSGDVDPLVVLLGPDRDPVRASDNAGSGDASAVIDGYTAITAGTYIILTTHALTGTDGDIILVIEVQD